MNPSLVEESNQEEERSFLLERLADFSGCTVLSDVSFIYALVSGELQVRVDKCGWLVGLGSAFAIDRRVFKRKDELHLVLPQIRGTGDPPPHRV